MNQLTYKILIIGDKDDIHLDLVNHFNALGYLVFSVKNTTEAVKLLDSRLPDLIITKLSFPNMDEFKILKYFRKKSNDSLIPIILLSTKIDGIMIKKIITYNINNYLRIPFKISELNNIVNELIKGDKAIN
jgi:PleD family two-component response regulator